MRPTLAGAQWRRLPRPVRRLLAGVIGTVLLIIGAALLVLPGPGIPVVLAALAVFSLEFDWARHQLERLRGHQRRANEKIRRRRSRPPEEQSSGHDDAR